MYVFYCHHHNWGKCFVLCKTREQVERQAETMLTFAAVLFQQSMKVYARLTKHEIRSDALTTAETKL